MYKLGLKPFCHDITIYTGKRDSYPDIPQNETPSKLSFNRVITHCALGTPLTLVVDNSNIICPQGTYNTVLLALYRSNDKNIFRKTSLFELKAASEGYVLSGKEGVYVLNYIKLSFPSIPSTH